MLHEIVPVEEIKDCPTDELRRRLERLQVAANGEPKADKECRECGEPLTMLELSAEHLAGTDLCSRCFKKRHAH